MANVLQPRRLDDPNDALNALRSMQSVTNVGGLSDEGLDIAQGLGDFEPSEADLMNAQRSATVTTPSGSFATPSRESLRGQAMGKVRQLLKMGDIKQQQAKELEAQKQAGETERSRIAANATIQRQTHTGEKWVTDVNGQKQYRVPMPGDTPYDAIADRQKAAQVSAASSPYQAERTARIRDNISNLRGQVGPLTTGLGGSLINKIAGTPARDFSAQVESLKANIGFGELAEMRAASKTGGALGNISDRENALLSATLGSLDPTQSPEAFRRQLDQIEASLARWEAAKKKFAGEAGAAPTGATPQTTPQAAPSSGGGRRVGRFEVVEGQ